MASQDSKFTISIIVVIVVILVSAAFASTDVQQEYDPLENTTLENSPQVFPDVSPNHRNFTAIRTLYENGLIQGYSDGTFRPAQLVTRAEATAMIVRGLDPDNPDPDPGRYKNCFDDVQREWFAKYVCFGKANRWLKGYYQTQLFKPGQNIIVVEALRMTIDGFSVPIQSPITLYKYMFDIPKGFKNEPERFPTQQWFEPYLVTARYYSFLDITPFATKLMSRGEVAEIIYRIMGHKDLL